METVSRARPAAPPERRGPARLVASLTRRLPLLALAALQASCCPCAREPMEFTVLQMNDIYEIQPLPGDDEGGLARVGALRQALLAENPNTITVLAGDLLSPSAMGTVKVDGAPLDGRQMVDMLMAVGVDVVTLGNHEFDLKEAALLQRLEQASTVSPAASDVRPFQWLSANVRRANGQALPRVRESTVLELPAKSGPPLRVGVIGVTIETPKCKDYVRYEAPLAAARRQATALRSRVDVLIAVTHLSLDEDLQIAAQVPDIDLILGGHEHVRHYEPGAPGRAPIVKADANARTVAIHRLRFDPKTRAVTTRSELRAIGPWQAADPALEHRAQGWRDRVKAALAAQGLDMDAVVATTTASLDGREEAVRYGPTSLTTLMAEGMLASGRAHAASAGLHPPALALFNSGSVRIDARLPKGPVTQWDTYRVLPYTGQLRLVEIDGATLGRLLDTNAHRAGEGEFLQTAGVTADGHGWRVDGRELQPGARYVAVINDYLQTRNACVPPGSEPTDPDRAAAQEALKPLAGLPVLAQDFKHVRESLADALRRAYP